MKGEIKYSQTMAATLHFLQYHNKRGETTTSNRGCADVHLLMQNGEEDKEKGKNRNIPDKKSKLCGKQKDGAPPGRGAATPWGEEGQAGSSIFARLWPTGCVTHEKSPGSFQVPLSISTCPSLVSPDYLLN